MLGLDPWASDAAHSGEPPHGGAEPPCDRGPRPASAVSPPTDGRYGMGTAMMARGRGGVAQGQGCSPATPAPATSATEVPPSGAGRLALTLPLACSPEGPLAL